MTVDKTTATLATVKHGGCERRAPCPALWLHRIESAIDLFFCRFLSVIHSKLNFVKHRVTASAGSGCSADSIHTLVFPIVRPANYRHQSCGHRVLSPAINITPALVRYFLVGHRILTIVWKGPRVADPFRHIQCPAGYRAQDSEDNG